MDRSTVRVSGTRSGGEAKPLYQHSRSPEDIDTLLDTWQCISRFAFHGETFIENGIFEK